MVFGKVTKGMEVVEAMEACGSEDGTVSKRVVVAACGELDEDGEEVVRSDEDEWDEKAMLEEMGLSFEGYGDGDSDDEDSDDDEDIDDAALISRLRGSGDSDDDDSDDDEDIDDAAQKSRRRAADE